jgi:hypothetical protein
MRSVDLGIAALLFLPIAALDAQKPSSIELDNLKTPTSPAFELLGVSPTAIARPATPRALATELLSSTNQGTVLPNSYALEVAPYWLRPRPKLTFQEYTAPSAGQSIRQTFTVSFATSRDSAADSTLTRAAIGVRLLPLSGRASRKFNSLLASLDSIQRTRPRLARKLADALDTLDEISARRPRLDSALAAATSARDAPAIAAAKRAIANDSATAEQARGDTASVTAELQTKADTQRVLARAMGDASAERMGHFLVFAGGLSGAAPDGLADQLRLSRVGAWATYSYRLESPRFDLIALLRFLHDGAGEDQNALDAGGRLLWLYRDLGISGEWVYRSAFAVSEATPVPGGTQRTVTLRSSSRIVGVAEYRATDAMYVTMTFGQDFKDLGVERRPLVAVFGLKLLYGDKPSVVLPP